MKKALSIIGTVLLYLFFAVCIFALILSVSAKKDGDGVARLFGKQMRVVVSNSMEKCEQTDVSEYEIQDIRVKSLLIIDLVPENEKKAKEWYDDLEVGDVLTFRYAYIRQETITHRIKEITPKGEGYILRLEGDNKASEGTPLTQMIDTTLTDSPNYVIGKVTGVYYGAGVFLTALQTPVGIICLIILPCLLIMAMEIVRLVSLLTERKREQTKEEALAKEQEIEELRRQLALLRAERGDEAAKPPVEKVEKEE